MGKAILKLASGSFLRLHQMYWLSLFPESVNFEVSKYVFISSVAQSDWYLWISKVYNDSGFNFKFSIQNTVIFGLQGSKI